MILPDVLIGAHALVAGIPLLTRNQSRYRRTLMATDLADLAGGSAV